MTTAHTIAHAAFLVVRDLAAPAAVIAVLVLRSRRLRGWVG